MRNQNCNCCRLFARINADTGWWNVRHDVRDYGDAIGVIPEDAWIDQAIFGHLLVPVFAWHTKDGLFWSAPIQGKWPTGADALRAQEATGTKKENTNG